jgi:diguanylate cyclase
MPPRETNPSSITPDFAPNLAMDGPRRSLLIALPFAGLAFVLGMVFNPISQQSTPFDDLLYPILSIGMFLVHLFLLLNKRSTNAVILVVVNLASLFFLAKLSYILFFGPATINIVAEMTEGFFWIPAMFVLSAFAQVDPRARILPNLFMAGMTLLSGTYIVINLRSPNPNYGTIYALLEMGLAHITLLSLSKMLFTFRDDYIRAESSGETMKHLAYTDQLTGLANRLGIQMLLENTLKDTHNGAGNQPISLIFLDLDGFKAVNDTLGSSIGDQVLREVAHRWQGFCRDRDSLGRWSGDEFVAILHDVAGQEATGIANRLIGALSEPISIGEHLLQLTASAGISSFPEDGSDPHKLIRHADSALNTIKRSGKNNVRRFTPEIEGEIEERQQLERDLRLALERHELELAYQPIIDLKSGQTIKAEALLRWRHPTRGMISPATFIPIAESSGLIVNLGNWILNEACLQAKIWNQPGRQEIRMAVNISAVQLGHPDFLNVVAQTLAKTGLPAKLLELELTESTVLRDISEVQRTLSELRELGISLAIDDFGTGYSSLSYLRDLPIQTIKIDRSFVKDLGSTRFGPQFALALIEAILSIARTLDLEVVAEGIEDESQLAVLRGLGCSSGQGYLFARPEPGQVLEHRLQNAPLGIGNMPSFN